LHTPTGVRGSDPIGKEKAYKILLRVREVKRSPKNKAKKINI
jgi:hypothetical protein